MKILEENNNRLVFKIYPGRNFIIVFFIIILLDILCIIFLQFNLINEIAAFTFLVILIIYISCSLIFPLEIIIDRTKNLLNYHDFSLFPALVVIDPNKPPIYQYNPNTLIELDKLKQIEVKKVWGGIINPTYYNWFYNQDAIGNNNNIGICFIMNDNKTKNIFPGMLTYWRHRSACIKISEFLNIPFIDSSQ